MVGRGWSRSRRGLRTAGPPTHRVAQSVNDEGALIYVAALLRSVTALHDLVSNKAAYKADEDKAPGDAAAAAAAAAAKDGKAEGGNGGKK